MMLGKPMILIKNCKLRAIWARECGRLLRKPLINASRANAVVIGSDCMELEAWHVQAAFEQLARHDFVMGPTTDGGYYLLGMKRFYVEPFLDKPWSTPQVFTQTLDDMAKLNKSCYVLPMLRDVDFYEDWLAVSQNNMQQKRAKTPNKGGKS